MVDTHAMKNDRNSSKSANHTLHAALPQSVLILITRRTNCIHNFSNFFPSCASGMLTSHPLHMLLFYLADLRIKSGAFYRRLSFMHASFVSARCLAAHEQNTAFRTIRRLEVLSTSFCRVSNFPNFSLYHSVSDSFC